MATKDDVIAWGEATGLFDKGRFQEAIPIYTSIAPAIGSKILFNVGMCQGGAKRNNEAIEAFSQAVKSDKYFAAAYFQRGYYQILNNAYAKAVQDYNFAYDNLRGNQLIDYTQLGLRYQLYMAEVLYNRALCKAKLNDSNGAFQDIAEAQSYKATPEHDKIIDEAVRTQRYGNPFFIPNLVYTPPEQKLKNTGKIDFLGNSKIVATTDAQDNIIGFKDAKLRRMAQERESPSPPPSRPSNPPPPSSSSSSSSSAAPPSRPAPPSSRPPPSSSANNNNNSAPAPPSSRPPPASSSSSSAASAYSSSPSSSSSSSSLLGGSKIKVKCHYKDTRVVLIEDNIRFEDLLKRVSEKFDGAKIKLKYRDEDQDMVLLTDQEDLSLAFSFPDVAAGKLELWCF